MGKLYSFAVVSTDGYCEGPNQEFDWQTVDEEFLEFSAEQLAETETLVFGRVTYEGMAAYWPTAADIAIFGSSDLVEALPFAARLCVEMRQTALPGALIGQFGASR